MSPSPFLLQPLRGVSTGGGGTSATFFLVVGNHGPQAISDSGFGAGGLGIACIDLESAKRLDTWLHHQRLHTPHSRQVPELELESTECS